eukprot:scaffold310170_cov75-Attheya_sp.AAC.4
MQDKDGKNIHMKRFRGMTVRGHEAHKVYEVPPGSSTHAKFNFKTCPFGAAEPLFFINKTLMGHGRQKMNSESNTLWKDGRNWVFDSNFEHDRAASLACRLTT